MRIGISICEDIWNDKSYWLKGRCDREPVTEQVAAGAELLINVSASPYERDKPELRRQMLLRHRDRHQRPILYVNQVGGNDSLLFDGRSMAVGYSTLYGDMCGGLAVISDVYKTDIYALVARLNAAAQPPIPQASITKPPSAELRANQTDQDSLPPYEQLDAVLREYIDDAQSADAVISHGQSEALVRRVIAMVDRAEYKRRQMPPGLRVSRKAFGEGRRLPIAQRYRDTRTPGR